MTITATQSAAVAASNATASTSSSSLQGTTSEFLQLFMAQLQNQDPLDPQTGSDMVAQLAQLTSVEQQQTTNTDLSTLVAGQSSQTTAQLSNLVGRTLDVATGSFSVQTPGTGVPPIEVTSTLPTNGASVTITDANGNVVRQIPIPNGSTSTPVTWDGNNASGVPAAAGNYTVTVNPGSTGGSVSGQWQGVVSSVQLGASGAELQIGNLLFSPSAVASIGMTGSTSTTSTSSTIPTSVSTTNASTTAGASQ
jgi:flagellar basal-body rod modification protein FlgD